MTTQLIFRPRIVPIGKELTLIQARSSVADKGGLPSQLLVDRLFTDIAYRNTLSIKDLRVFDSVNSLGARQLLAHPAVNQPFEQGQDIKDKQWGEVPEWRHDMVLPWSEVVALVPASEITARGIGLFIEPRAGPEGVVEETLKGEKLTVIHPASIILVQNMLQETGWGKKDPATGIPVKGKGKRVLFRKDFQAISLLVRETGSAQSTFFTINAFYSQVNAFGVAYVTHDLIELNTEGILAKEIVRDVSLADIRKLAAGETPEALSVLTSVQLEAASLAAKSMPDF
ncbi:MAG: hypothetical protein Q7S22_04105 [Candidatus Micrarchaeota archaeon]|nr:hypothetical protein [Candidatus Micrarchaeota archaeon]